MNGRHEWKARPPAQRDEHTGHQQRQDLENRQRSETRDIRRPARNGQICREPQYNCDSRDQDGQCADNERTDKQTNKHEVAEHRNRAQAVNDE